MACSCLYDCTCGQRTLGTTTTTTTTLCPDAIFCDSVYKAECVVYSGCDDVCHEIYTGDPLAEVFLKIFTIATP